MAELDIEPWIGDPAEINTKRVKKQQKIDRKDAQLLLRFMQADNRESFCFTIAKVQTQLAALTGVLIQKSDLLKTRVVRYAYQEPVRFLAPEPPVVMQPKFARVEGAGIVMQSSGISL